MSLLAIVDAGPLYAAADGADDAHAECLEVLARPDLQLVLPALALAEATYFVGRGLGPSAEGAFLKGAAEPDLETPTGDDLERMSELVERHRDLPLGGTDASVIALAERLDAEVIVTLDRRHFAAVKPRHRESFELLP